MKLIYTTQFSCEAFKCFRESVRKIGNIKRRTGVFKVFCTHKKVKFIFTFLLRYYVDILYENFSTIKFLFTASLYILFHNLDFTAIG